MHEFRWTASRLQRLRSAVRAFNAAITRRERELADEGLSHLSALLPDRVTTQGVMSRVHDVNDFRRIIGYRSDARRGRTSELTRVLRTVRPDALAFTTDAVGAPVTRYEQREARNAVIAVRRQRNRTLRDMGRSLYDGDEAYDVSSMTPIEAMTLMSDTDMMPEDSGVRDTGPESEIDPATLERWRREDARAKRDSVQVDSMYHVYRAVWVNPLNFHQAMGRYDEMLSALDWLAENRPDVLNKEFAKGRDELDPQYITESGGISNPYVNTPYSTRHDRAVSYVVSVAERAGMHGLG